MQAINHTVTATIIALTVKQPALVAPLALASHFALDMVPHYENVPPWKPGGSHRRYYNTIYVDAVVTAAAYVGAVVIWHADAWLITMAVLLAISPDFFWPLQRKIEPKGLLWNYLKWHKAIQWSESTKGIIMEALWLAAGVTILANMLP